MKFLLPLALLLLTQLSIAQKPAPFQDAFNPGKPQRGQLIVVQPPEEISQYLRKVQDAAAQDPEWYAQYSKEATPGVPLPYHPKIGLTPEEYDAYLKLWRERKTIVRGQLALALESDTPFWRLRVSGPGWPISLLKYDPEKDCFLSPNGALQRLPDIDAPADSILGAWTGQEWRYEENNTISNLRENLAIGRQKDGKFGLLIYRLQETSRVGRLLDDKSLVIRFLLPTQK